jgi:hypothetical protein
MKYLMRKSKISQSVDLSERLCIPLVLFLLSLFLYKLIIKREEIAK